MTSFWSPETFFSSYVGDCAVAREQSPPSFRKLWRDCVTPRSERDEATALGCSGSVVVSPGVTLSPGSPILRKSDEPDSILGRKARRGGSENNVPQVDAAYHPSALAGLC